MSTHNHSCTCEHESVKICKHCSVVYCEGCNQEWTKRTLGYQYGYYPWSTYTTSLDAGLPNTAIRTVGNLGDALTHSIDIPLNDGHTHTVENDSNHTHAHTASQHTHAVRTHEG